MPRECTKSSLANVPRTPTHTPAAPPRPDPTRSLPRTRKKCHPAAPPVPSPASIQPHTRPTSSPRLRHFFPPIRPNPAISPPLLKDTHIRATLAHARDRPRGPETLTPNGMRPQASVRASKTGLRPPDRHLSYSVTRRDTCAPKTPRQHYRFAHDRRHPQLGNEQNDAETNTIRLPAKPVPVEACPELAEWAGSGNNGVRGAK